MVSNQFTLLSSKEEQFTMEIAHTMNSKPMKIL